MHTEHGLDRFPCPYCRGATAIPEEGATAFPVNASIGWSELDHLPVCPSHAGEKLRAWRVVLDAGFLRILTTEGKLAAVDKKERSATARFNSKARIIAYTVKETEEATRVWRQEKNRKLFLSQVKASSDFRRWRIKVTKELDHLEDLLARSDLSEEFAGLL
nr:hypothetical protein BaRGS_010245 [Batillaria attramentaria]